MANVTWYAYVVTVAGGGYLPGNVRAFTPEPKTAEEQTALGLRLVDLGQFPQEGPVPPSGFMWDPVTETIIAVPFVADPIEDLIAKVAWDFDDRDACFRYILRGLKNQGTNFYPPE